MFRRRQPTAAEGASRDALAAMLAASAALTAAEQAGVLAGRAVHLLEGLEEQSFERTPRRLRILTACCALLTLLTALGCWLVPPGFSTPAPEVTNPGLMQVAVELGPEPTPAEQVEIRKVVLRAEVGEVDGSVDYAINFPESMRGKTFRVLLAGSAALTDYPPVVEDTYSIQTGDCRDPQIIPNYYVEDLQCQVISGTIGTGEYLGGDLLYPLQQCRGEDRDDLGGDFYQTIIYGSAAPSERTDWAHRTTNVLDVSGVSSWGDADAGGSMFGLSKPVLSAPLPTACRELELGTDLTEHASSIDPSAGGPQRLEWVGHSSENAAVISTNRNAGGLANLFLAGIGVTAALLIGLVPVTYDCWRRRQRYLRSLRPDSDLTTS